jgi:hypothetical protein
MPVMPNPAGGLNPHIQTRRVRLRGIQRVATKEYRHA